MRNTLNPLARVHACYKFHMQHLCQQVHGIALVHVMKYQLNVRHTVSHPRSMDFNYGCICTLVNEHESNVYNIVQDKKL